MGKCKAGDLVRVKRTIVENLGKGSWGAYADKDAVVDHTDCTGDQYCLCFKEMGVCPGSMILMLNLLSITEKI